MVRNPAAHPQARSSHHHDPTHEREMMEVLEREREREKKKKKKKKKKRREDQRGREIEKKRTFF